MRPWNDLLLVSVLKGQNVLGVSNTFSKGGKKDTLEEVLPVILLRVQYLQNQHRYRTFSRELPCSCGSSVPLHTAVIIARLRNRSQRIINSEPVIVEKRTTTGWLNPHVKRWGLSILKEFIWEMISFILTFATAPKASRQEGSGSLPSLVTGC